MQTFQTRDAHLLCTRPTALSLYTFRHVGNASIMHHP